MEIVRDIDEETVDFAPNYDGRTAEPTILPSRFPNLLVNGSAGIAVGMATNIPPHNLREVASGVQRSLHNPAATREELIEALWSDAPAEEVPNERTIDVHVRRLRVKLAQYQDIVRTVRGIGYISDMIFDRELDYYSLLGRESEPALTSNSLIMQLRWCLRGCGLCILPDFVAGEHSELEVVLPEEIRLMRAFYLVRHQDDARVARINRMAEVIVDWMRTALVPGEESREN